MNHAHHESFDVSARSSGVGGGAAGGFARGPGSGRRLERRTSSAWNNAANWVGGVPGSGDSAEFNAASAYANQPAINAASLSVGQIWEASALGQSVTVGADAGADPFTLKGVSGIGVEMDAAAASLTLSAPLTLGGAETWLDNGGALTAGKVANGGYTLTVAGSGASSISGILSGSGGLLKSSAGTLTLTAINTYYGGTTLSSGTLNVNSNVALGNGALTINGGTIDCTAAGAVNWGMGNLYWNGSFAFGGTKALELGSDYTVTLGSSCTLTAGGTSALTVDGGINDGGKGYSLTKAGPGTLVLTQLNTYKGGTTVSAGTLAADAGGALGTGNVTVGGGTLTAAVATNALTGSQALIVCGGTASLGKANNYGGGTTVSGGTLLAANSSGSATGSGPVTVGGGGILGGNGFLGGAVTVQSGGHLAPSTGLAGGTATLTLGGGLTLAAGSSLDFNFGLVGGNPACDLAVVNGTLSLPGSGAVALNVNPLASLTTGSYDFLNYSGSPIPGAAGSFSPPAGTSTYSYTIGTAAGNGMNELLLNVAVSAGPVTWAGGGAGAWTGNGVWQNGASYVDGYPVTFDDSATGTTGVTLNSTVRPASVTFANTGASRGGKSYTLSGSGTLADAPGGAATSLTVNGGGTVTLGNLDGGYAYSGPTTVCNGSTLLLDGSTIRQSNVTLTGANLGATANGGTIAQTLSVGGNSALLDGGTVTVTGQATVNNGLFTIGNGAGNATLDANGGLAVSGGSIAAKNAASNNTVNIGSSQLLSYTSSTGSLFQGVLGGNGGLLLNSIAGATLELANPDNSYGGGTTVAGGLLQLDSGGALPPGGLLPDGLTPAGEMLDIGSADIPGPATGVLLNSFLMPAGDLGYGSRSGGPAPAPADASAVPEPGTLLLLAAAALLALRTEKRCQEPLFWDFLQGRPRGRKAESRSKRFPVPCPDSAKTPPNTSIT